MDEVLSQLLGVGELGFNRKDGGMDSGIPQWGGICFLLKGGEGSSWWQRKGDEDLKRRKSRPSCVS